MFVFDYLLDRLLFEVAVSGTQHAQLQMHDSKKRPSMTVEWLDGEHPRRVVSEDGYDLVYHIPNGIKDKSRVRVLFYWTLAGSEIYTEHFHRSSRQLW